MKSWKECHVCGEFLSRDGRNIVCVNGCFVIEAKKLNNLNKLLDMLYVHFPAREGVCHHCKGVTSGHKFCDECYNDHVLEIS